jgi:CopG family transcriptional regulator, nickel-responsive regulator
MQRITITIDEDLLETVDALMRRRGYASRSEALRDMIRSAAARDAVSEGKTLCMAVLGYVYDHETRALAQRLSRTLHDHHDLAVASMRVPIDHASSLDVSVLKGPMSEVHGLVDAVTAQRGVRHANLHVVPVRTSKARHDHGAGTSPHSHIHA